MYKTRLNSMPTGIRIIGFLLTICISFSLAELDTHVPMGWAVVPTSEGRPGIDGKDVENTIGGGNGRLVEASGGELAKYTGGSEPLVILFKGSCGSVNVGSNKTIIGIGSDASINGQMSIDGVSNVIVRNIRVSGGTDGISLSKTHHVWIDHCDMSSCGDGLIDMKRGADKITISWTKFSDHHKTMLINHGKLIDDDEGRLNITLHHNWHEKSRTRNPRVGFGQVQILNNYYHANGYAIHTYWNAEVVIERCYFKDVRDAVSDHKGSTPGTWPGPGYVVLIDNYTTVPGSIKKKTTTDPERIFNIDGVYMYDWVVTKDVQKVPDVVSSGAGTGQEWGKIGAIPTPGHGYTKVSTSPTLKWTKVGSKESNKVYFGNSYPPPEVATVDGYSYKPGNLKNGTVYYWKINDGKAWKFRTQGKPVAVRPNPSISRKSTPNPTTFQKGEPGRSTVLISVKKGKDGKRLYDLNGRNQLHPEGRSGTNYKKADN